ncbi:hypothetical protein CK203_116265 [Vitis vinifera]|uniref:Uncharacterized protein n=1 Tax=Vitis vinifera TaxID=29760 RepID=A0A438E2W0_VITVI|nr:hypothetical protein CK203_116265 [Vitis vinifera]
MCLWDKILVSSRVSSGVEMRVVVVLALLFWGFSHEVEGGRATSISKEEDLELERELRRLNKPTIKSFHARNSFLEFYMLYILPLISTEYGDIFDCVDINKQPALDHPLLKNHRVQKKPSVFLKGLGPKTSAKTQSSKIGLPDGGFPEGTVPIKRITKRDLIWMKSLKRNTTKFHPMDGNTPGYHQVYTKQNPSTYCGAQGGLSLHSEPAANHRSHRAMITVSGGSPDKLNAIQVGWTVDKDAYGDGATRMFIFWTISSEFSDADNFVNTGCRTSSVPVVDEVGIMLLYEGEWVRDGNVFYLKEVKYVFNANIPTSLIQLTDDGDVKFFIGLNCTNGKLPVPLCITVEKRIDNHNQKSICNSYFECHMSSEIDKELNGDSMLMQKSRHIHCDSVETLTVDGENGRRFQNESLEGYKVHDWNMNETAINEEDYMMNTNPTSDKQVTQIGSFRAGSA